MANCTVCDYYSCSNHNLHAFWWPNLCYFYWFTSFSRIDFIFSLGFFEPRPTMISIVKWKYIEKLLRSQQRCPKWGWRWDSGDLGWNCIFIEITPQVASFKAWKNSRKNQLGFWATLVTTPGKTLAVSQ